MSKPKKSRTGLGERLKSLREGQGLSQPELSHAIKIAAGTISRWEREVGSPQAEQLLILARHFKVSLDYLLLGTDREASVHSPVLHKFLGTTTAGRKAKELGLVDWLVSQRFPEEPTVEVYRQVTNAMVALLEAAEDASTPTTDTHKKPGK